MEISSSLPKGTGVSAENLPPSSRYFNKTVGGDIYFKLRKVGIEGLYADAFSRIYDATKATTFVKRWIQKVEDKSDSEGRATIFTGCLKLNLK